MIPCAYIAEIQESQLEIMMEKPGEKNTPSPFEFVVGGDGVPVRCGFWPCRSGAKAGAVLLLNGRGEFMEKYQETIADLGRRHFDVYSLDWRGQGLSGRMLLNRHKGHVTDFQCYLKDLQTMVEKKLDPRVRPVIALAHSMGGHILLRHLYVSPGTVDRVILTSPMMGLHLNPFPPGLVRLLCRLAVRLGRAHCYTFGSHDYGPADRDFDGNRLTTDPDRFQVAHRFIAENPDLALGGVTYGWLDASLRSIDILMDPAFAAAITVPLLIVSAGSERIVSNRAQQMFCSRSSNCVLKEIPNARHEILFEKDSVRAEFWRRFDRFVQAVPFTASAL